MHTVRILVTAALCFFMTDACHAEELAFICESDGRCSRIEQYKQEVIEELTRRCLRSKVVNNAIVDIVVDGHGQILRLSLASTGLDPKAEKWLITQLKTIKFGSRVDGPGGYLKMTLRFTVDPKLWETKAADAALMKKLTTAPSVSGQAFANKIQLVWNQRVALEKVTKAIWASHGKGLPRQDTKVAWVKYAKKAEEHLALGLRASAAKEFLTASLEAFVGGKPQEGKACVGRAIALSNQLTWHQNRYIYKELCSITGRLVNNSYQPVSRDSAEVLHQSVDNLRSSLLAKEPKKQSVLLKLSSGLSERPSFEFVCGTGRRHFSGGAPVKRELSALESSVESCRKLANAASRTKKQQAVVELKKALNLMEFEYGKNSIECLPELCTILKLELDQRRAEEAFRIARQIYAVAESYEQGEENDRHDEWGDRQGLYDLEALARECFGSHYATYEYCSSWKKPIAEILFRSEYMLTLKTASLEWPAIQETLLNLCGFLANNDKVEESINLFKQAIRAYKEVHSYGVKSLTEEFAEVLERAGKTEQAREVRNTIGATSKRPENRHP